MRTYVCMRLCVRACVPERASASACVSCVHDVSARAACGRTVMWLATQCVDSCCVCVPVHGWRCAGDRGIVTILDAHQDLYSPRFCGEGAPDWAVLPYVNASLPFPSPVGPVFNLTQAGYPARNECITLPFALMYASDGVGAAFQNLYSNNYGIGAAFRSFWLAVAQRFANNSNVLGYELLNEPWAGDIFKDPSLVIPGEADRKNLAPFYTLLHNTIRQVDNEHIIFFEPGAWRGWGVEGWVGGGRGNEGVGGPGRLRHTPPLSVHLRRRGLQTALCYDRGMADDGGDCVAVSAVGPRVLPVTIFADLPLGNITTTGLTAGPGGPEFNDRQVYAYHTYW